MRRKPTHLIKQIAAAAGAALALTAVPASAHPVDFVADLFGSLEATPNNSPAIGRAVITLNEDDFTMRVQASFSGMLGNVTNAHIHCCTTLPGAGTAGVATPTPTFPGFPSGVTAGSYDRTFDLSLASSWNPAYITANGGTVAAAFSAFSTGMNSGRAYFNIHSTLYTGGEIRGFLAPVPEPETWALLLGGLGVIALARRRG